MTFDSSYFKVKRRQNYKCRTWATLKAQISVIYRSLGYGVSHYNGLQRKQADKSN